MMNEELRSISGTQFVLSKLSLIRSSGCRCRGESRGERDGRALPWTADATRRGPPALAAGVVLYDSASTVRFDNNLFAVAERAA
jgi:hypothetical protein